VVRIGVSLVLVVVTFWFVLPQIADFSQVWGEIRAMTGLELAILALVAAWNLVTYWIVTVAATPGLTFGQSVVLTESTTAVANAIPGGMAVAVGLTYAMLGSWGFSKSRSTVSLVVSGIWNNFVKLGMPIVALALLAFQGESDGSRIVAGVVGLAVLAVCVGLFALVLHSDDVAARVGEATARIVTWPRRLFRRPPAEGWGEATVKFRRRVVGLVRRSWVWLTVSSLVGHLSLYLVLLVTLRDIGVSNEEVSWIQVLAVFAFVRLLSAIPLTPGGLGIVELGLIGGLTAAGGDRAQVVAAVLVFRLLTFASQILIGAVTYVYWRRNTSWLNSAPPLDPSLTPMPATVG
jgi:uncharacterized protein (TIRG00374 family)